VEKILLFAVISVLIVSVSIISISAQSQADIPAWVKGVANFWVDGNISDSEFGESISFLIEQKIIQVEMPETDDFQKIDTIRRLVTENKKLETENKNLKGDVAFLEAENKRLRTAIDNFLDDSSLEYSDDEYLDNGCPVSNPYLWSDGLCHTIPEPNCPADHPYSWSDGFCYKSSEYLENGCQRNYPYLWLDGQCHTIPEYTYDEPVRTTPSCDPSYPDVCIAPYPPDLDCDEIFYSNFRVVGSDPHGFDRDNDGIGCEVGSPQSSKPSCDPSYPDVCIAPYPPDLDCGEIGYSNFRVVGSDPHGFDRDNDGIGCES